MPDFSTPAPISDQIEDLAGGLFDPEVLGRELTLKCRYSYLHGKIKSAQENGKPVDDRHMQKLNELEDKLMDNGIRPSTVIDA